MVKREYVGCLFLFLFLQIPCARAIDFPENYRKYHLDIEYTKQTKSFDIKNTFPFHLPSDLPGIPIFKGAKGYFATTTKASYDPKTNLEITASETLFSVEIVRKSCPKPGQEIRSMGLGFGSGNHQPLVWNIVKQSHGNKTQYSYVDFMNNFDISMDAGKEGCGVVDFDGTDFVGKPYTMHVNLDLYYTFKPILSSIGGEYKVGVDNKIKANLNAYQVIPVTKGKGEGEPLGVLRPGILFAANGNVAADATSIDMSGNWYVRFIMAVYKKNSCQVAFKNHLPKKFSWNDHTGTATKPNPTSALWPTSNKMIDFTVSGNGRGSVNMQVPKSKNLPIHVDDGDCVVMAALPYGDDTTGTDNSLNIEAQLYVVSIPD